MKLAAGFVVLVCGLFSFASFGSTDATAETKLQIRRVLSGRIYKLLEFRLQGLNSCDVETQTSFQSRFKNFPSYSDNSDTVLDLIDFYHDTYLVALGCLHSLNQAEDGFSQLERKRFKVFNQLSRVSGPLRQMFLDLDPNCESVQVPNKAGYDAFPCMAGEKLLSKSLLRGTSPGEIARDEADFLVKIQNSLLDAGDSTIDLYELFQMGKQDSTSLRERFLAMMTVLSASSSAQGSYTQEYHFDFFRRVLFESNSPELALETYQQFRLHIDQFRTLLAMSGSQKKVLLISGNSLNRVNHHDLMAAFMSCYYRDESILYRRWLPVALGYVYESYDLKGNLIDERHSLSESYAEFKVDTARHRTGVRWGSEFCSIK